MNIAALLLGMSLAASAESIRTFHDAVQHGDTRAVRGMLAADPALAVSADKHQFQPIHLLDMYFERDILELLLANGANINARTDNGTTLLHIIRDEQAIALLVKCGAQLEARDRNGDTPLNMQTEEAQDGPQIVIALLASGAEPNTRNNRGLTPLAKALGRDDDAVVAALRQAGAKQ